MQVKLRRQEQYQQEMNAVGTSTDSDLRTLFKPVYEDISKRIQKQVPNVCYWEDCLQVQKKNRSEKHLVDSIFETAELLQKVVKCCSCTNSFR